MAVLDEGATEVVPDGASLFSVIPSISVLYCTVAKYEKVFQMG